MILSVLLPRGEANPAKSLLALSALDVIASFILLNVGLTFWTSGANRLNFFE